jgi:hypothetical protein
MRVSSSRKPEWFLLRNDQWSKKTSGFNVSALEPMTFSESLPVNLRDACVLKYAHQWSVALPVAVNK